MDNSIVSNVKLFGMASLDASKMGPDYKLAMYEAIKEEYLLKPYNLKRFEEYYRHSSDEEVSDVRTCYKDLAKIIDSRINSDATNVMFVEHIYQDDFYGEGDTNMCIDHNIWFTCQFMARVININIGDRYVMNVGKLHSQMNFLVIQARRDTIIGYIMLPEGAPENGYVYAAKRTLSYNISEAEEIAKLKSGDKVLVEFIRTPVVTPKGLICTCKFVSKVE